MLYSSEDQFYRKSISFLFCQKSKIKMDVSGNDNIVPTGYAFKIVPHCPRICQTRFEIDSAILTSQDLHLKLNSVGRTSRK